MDRRPLGLLFTLRRTIKGEESILSTVHSTSICPTPDTFHSDSASCSARAATPPRTFKLVAAATMPHFSQYKQEFSLICPRDMCTFFCMDTRPNSHDARQPTFSRVGVFFLVPLTSDPGNPHVGQRTFYGGDGMLRIRLSARKTLSYPKALEKLYSTQSQTIISQTLHAYVVMRLST